jgi:type IV pilus assembly protein PilV
MNSSIHDRVSVHGKQRGFSMIEVLVTLMFIAFALLGTAGLQAYAMRVSQGGQFRTQAVFLVADLAERMEANKAGAVAGAYAQVTSGTPAALSSACTTLACIPADLAAYDLSQWQNAIAAVLPQSTWTVTQTVTGNPSTYTITVSWVDRRTDTAYESAATGETFSYTATRTIFN